MIGFSNIIVIDLVWLFDIKFHARDSKWVIIIITSFFKYELLIIGQKLQLLNSKQYLSTITNNNQESLILKSLVLNWSRKSECEILFIKNAKSFKLIFTQSILSRVSLHLNILNICLYMALRNLVCSQIIVTVLNHRRIIWWLDRTIFVDECCQSRGDFRT